MESPWKLHGGLSKRHRAYFAGNAGHVCNSSDADQDEYSDSARGNNPVDGRVWAAGTGTIFPNDTDNKRQIATTNLGAYQPSIQGGGPQPFYEAQFRNPLSPNNPNSFGLTVPVTQLSGTTNVFDSGGPLWIQTAQGLVQIGLVQGGSNPVAPFFGYGDIGDWTPVNLFLDWIAQNDPLRKVTAAPGNFNWSNPAAWVDSVPGVVSAVPNNTVISYTAGARYYDVTLSNPGTITLDMNPTIDTLAIAGGSRSSSSPRPTRLRSCWVPPSQTVTH